MPDYVVGIKCLLMVALSCSSQGCVRACRPAGHAE